MNIEAIIKEVEKGSNKAFCELIKYAVYEKKYELFFKYLDSFISTENKLYKNDYNLYLYLLSIITKVPTKYNNYVKSLALEDILIPIKNTKDNNIILENEARTLIYSQKLSLSKSKLNKAKRLYNDRIGIIDELVKESMYVQNSDKNNILELLNKKDYEGIIRFLKEKEIKINLSTNDKYILHLSEVILEIIKTNTIPPKMNITSNSIFTCIDEGNYYYALELTKKYSKKKNILLKENTIYLLLCDICSLISEIEENKVDIPNIISKFKKKKYDNGFKILKEYLLINNIERYDFLITNLFKISIIKNSTNYEEIINIINKIMDDNYLFDINEYIYLYQQAISNKENELSILYLDIIDKSHDLVINKGKIENDSTNIVNYNKDVDFIYEKLNEIKNGKHLLIIDDMSEERRTNIHKIIEDINGVTSFEIQEEGSTKIVIRIKPDIEESNIMIDEIIYNGYKFFKRKNYDKSIEWYLKLFSLDNVSPFVYARIAMAYSGKLNKKEKEKYLKVATLLEDKKQKKYDYNKIAMEYENTIFPPDDEEETIVDIDEYYGLDKIEEIAYLIFQKGNSIDDVSLILKLNEEEKNMAILLIARESYYQKKYELGDYYIEKMSKIKNRSPKVNKLYKKIIKERNFYKNRDDTNHKKLVLYKKA